MHLRAHGTQAHMTIYNCTIMETAADLQACSKYLASICTTLHSYKNVFEYIKKRCALRVHERPLALLWLYMATLYCQTIYLSSDRYLSTYTHNRTHTHTYTWANRKQICRLTLHFDAAPIAELAPKKSVARSIDGSIDRSM
jgi:hypothetical protein